MNFKVGDRVFTRDGREVEILKVDAPGSFPIIGMCLNDGYPQCWTHDGQVEDDGYKRGNDLLPPKRTREVNWWFNIYETYEAAFSSEEQARDNVYGGALAVAVPHTFILEW